MKSKMLLLAAGLVALIAFAGCSSLPTVQEQFNTLCPTVTADLQIVATTPLLTADQQKVAQVAHDMNVKVCAAGATVNVADLKDLANTALPAVATIIAAIPPTPQFPSTMIALGINTFGPILLQLAEQIAAPLTTAPAAAPAAASAPAVSQ